MPPTSPPTTAKPTGILSHLPSPWVPYAELIRLHKPTGIFNIYFPYLFGALYASWTTNPSIPDLLTRITILFLAAFLLRSLGCSWNDIVDRNLDRHVARCRHRPMARGAIPVPHAVLFTTALYVVWLVVLGLLIPLRDNWFYILPLTGLVAFYPFAKRVTHHAQVVLGVTLAWGVGIGSLAMGVEPFLTTTTSSNSNTATEYKNTDRPTQKGLLPLTLTYFLWTILHDTIYAQQDVRDDLATGIKSMAVYYQPYLRTMLSGLGALQIALQVYTGSVVGAGLAYQLLASGGSGALILCLVGRVRLNDPGDCAWWFRTGCLVYGGLVAGGIFVEGLF